MFILSRSFLQKDAELFLDKIAASGDAVGHGMDGLECTMDYGATVIVTQNNLHSVAATNPK